MIFVTLGSQKFQFDRLLKKTDELIDKGIITDEVFAQIGASTYIPRNYKYTRFMDREEFSKCIEEASLIVTHGGTGVINCSFFISSMNLELSVPAMKWIDWMSAFKKYGTRHINHMCLIHRQSLNLLKIF